MTKTLTFTLTGEETINLWNTVRSQLVDARRMVREGYGSDELVTRLEVLHERLVAMCLEFSNPQKAGA